VAGVSSSSRFYIPQLDGLRFFAFLGVFLSHFGANEPSAAAGVRWYHAAWWGHSTVIGGGFGVVLFFVLSSYLITTLLVRELDTRGRIDVPAFWMRRVLRIWPLYFGYLFACAALGGLGVGTVVAFAFFAGNWAAVWGVNPGFAGLLWTVSVEEQFYLTWPLIMAALPRRLLRPAAIGLVVVAIAVRYALFVNGTSVAHVWLNTFVHLDAIGIGALVALSPTVRLTPVARGALGVASAVALIAASGVIWFELMEHPTVYVRAGGAAAAALTFFVVVFACGGLLLAALAGSAWLSRPWLVYLGRISYGLYVFHGVAVWLVAAWWWPWGLPAAFVSTLVAAAVSYRFLELPFLRLKSRFTHVSSGGDRIGLSPRKGNEAEPALGKEHEDNFRFERVP